MHVKAPSEEAQAPAEVARALPASTRSPVASAATLHSAIGNRAVGRLLAREPDEGGTSPAGGPLLAFAVPEILGQIAGAQAPPDGLDALPADLRRRIVLYTSNLVQTEIDRAFEVWGGTAKQADTITQTPVFSSTVPADADLRQGLINVAHKLNTTTQPMTTNQTASLHIEDVKGKQKGSVQPGGTYRFTRYLTPARGKGPAGPEVMLIEFLGAANARSPDLRTASGNKQNLENKYSQFRFTFDSAFVATEVPLIDTAMDRVSNAALGFVRNLTFIRRDKPPGAAEGGRYDPNTHTITLYATTFSQTSAAPGGYRDGQFTLAHEIGHALSEKDAGLAAAFTAAVKADGGAPLTAYGATSPVENLAESFALHCLDPGELRALRPATSALFSGRY